MNAFRNLLIFSLFALAITPSYGQNPPAGGNVSDNSPDNAPNKSVFLLDTNPVTEKAPKAAQSDQGGQSPSPQNRRPPIESSAQKPPPHLNQKNIIVTIKFPASVEKWDHVTEKAKIDAIIEKMQKKPNLRLAIYSYASGKPAKSNQYRRLALNRAWSIAEYFYKADIDSLRLTIFPIFQPIHPVFDADQAKLANDYIAINWLR